MGMCGPSGAGTPACGGVGGRGGVGGGGGGRGHAEILLGKFGTPEPPMSFKIGTAPSILAISLSGDR